MYASLLLYVVLLQALGLLGHDGFLAIITAFSPGLFQRESSPRVSVLLPSFVAASSGRESCQTQKLLEGTEHLTAYHPQIMSSAEGNLSQPTVLRGLSSRGKG